MGSLACMAERAGFEPAVPVTQYAGLAIWRATLRHVRVVTRLRAFHRALGTLYLTRHKAQ